MVGPELAEAWHYFVDDTTRFAETAREYVGPVTQWLLSLGAQARRRRCSI